MQLKVRVDHLMLGLGALAVLVGGIVGVRGIMAWRSHEADQDQAELDEGLDQLRSKSGSGASRPQPRFIRGFHSAPANEAREGWAEAEVPAVGDPGDVDPEQAVDDFKAVMQELEDAAESGRKLGRTERAELYNRATGSFTVLSGWIDGSDASERAVIDDAYAQMMGLMRQLDLEPPRRDPDYNPRRL